MNSQIQNFYQFWCKNLKLFKIISDKIKNLLEDLYNTCTIYYNSWNKNDIMKSDILEVETKIYKIMLEIMLLMHKLEGKYKYLIQYIENTKSHFCFSLTEKEAKIIETELNFNQYKKFSQAFYYLSMIISNTS